MVSCSNLHSNINTKLTNKRKVYGFTNALYLLFSLCKLHDCLEHTTFTPAYINYHSIVLLIYPAFALLQN
jgi:hypothetical protein